MNIVGISAFYHDSAAVLVKDGKVVSAAQEERFTRKKHDPGFPENAIKFCLESNGLSAKDVDYFVFYDKPLLKFERLLETYLHYVPRGFKSFLLSMPIWLKEKLFLRQLIVKELNKISGTKKYSPKLLFSTHHKSHAASAFYPSPFQEAAVLCMDGVGEWATTSVWSGKNSKLELLWTIDFPHSLGLLYSAFTYFTGFKVNSGEYKLMGLAPYGNPIYTDLIESELIDIKPDGTFHLNMDYFEYPVGSVMTNNKFAKLFGGPPRSKEAKITQREMDLAASIQVVTEKVVLRLAKTIRQETGHKNLCLAGGVALNCVANGKLLRENIFENIWVQPASGDAGGALGAALAVWYEYLDNERSVDQNRTDSMSGAYLGPEFSQTEIQSFLDTLNAKYIKLKEKNLFSTVATELKEGKVVGWFQGKMEFGPRALGNRSILGDPRNSEMQKTMNLKIKYRESFRPFAPAVIFEDLGKYFDLAKPSPYMLLVDNVKKELLVEQLAVKTHEDLIDKINSLRSTLPAITHIDNSARIQTVHKDTNQKFYELLLTFKELTGCSVLVNTSFNVRGEPIVCSPEDAYRCFMRTEMDVLVLGDLVLYKHDQPYTEKQDNWQTEFELD